MSDLEVLSALEAMERLLHGGSVEPVAIAAWQQSLDRALATAERGAGWPDIVVRAHNLSSQLDVSANNMAVARDALRRELDLQAQGVRALKGYKPS